MTAMLNNVDVCDAYLPCKVIRNMKEFVIVVVYT